MAKSREAEKNVAFFATPVSRTRKERLTFIYSCGTILCSGFFLVFGHMDVSVLKCAHCDEAELELYYCETCDQSAECSNKISKSLLCETCIGPHVRTGHDVRTSKGQAPLVCGDHKKLHNLYCKSCDLTFCPKCLGEHSEHKMGSIDERATEIKKEVFEMLTTLELDEKPLRLKKENLSELQLSHRCQQNDLRDFIDKRIMKLRHKAFETIDDNLKLLEDERVKKVEMIDQVLNLQQESRGLLCATSPHLIKDFEKVKEKYEKTRITCGRALEIDYDAKSSEINEVEKVVSEFEKKLLDKLKTVFIKKCVEVFAVNAASDKTFLFSVGEGNIKVEVITWNESEAKLNHLLVGQLAFNDYVKHYYHLIDYQGVCSVVVMGKFAHRIDVKEDSECKLSKIAMPTFEQVLCPYAISKDEYEIHWCYWVEDRNLLKFSHNPLFEVGGLSSMPNFKAKGIRGPELCFVTECNRILIADPVKHSSELLLIDPAELQNVDRITFFNTTFLFCWSVQSSAIVCLRNENSRFNRFEIRNFENSSSVVMLDIARCWWCLTSLPRMITSEEIYNVFAFILK